MCLIYCLKSILQEDIASCCETWSLYGTLRKSFHQAAAILLPRVKETPNKPRDKMSSYAFFMQTCWEEHKKKYPDPLGNFTELSKKCPKRWKTKSAKEKSKLEGVAKDNKAHYDQEMKNYIPPTGQ